ncbi:cell division control protein 2 homolog C [Tanacetum coccineum]|uniref:Cell division control protein 2 homolog C n=1 Tax=Tanacetum coccineum TaxID=301880 RepID=A0ABQ5AR40_9ASTR
MPPSPHHQSRITTSSSPSTCTTIVTSSSSTSPSPPRQHRHQPSAVTTYAALPPPRTTTPTCNTISIITAAPPHHHRGLHLHLHHVIHPPTPHHHHDAHPLHQLDPPSSPSPSSLNHTHLVTATAAQPPPKPFHHHHHFMPHFFEFGWLGICLLAWMGRSMDIERRGLGELCTYDKMFSKKLSPINLKGIKEVLWPGVSSLKDWHVYPRWEPQNLARAVPSLGPDGIDLLSQMLKYDPADRISAKAAMDHPYFDSLDKSQSWMSQESVMSVPPSVEFMDSKTSADTVESLYGHAVPPQSQESVMSVPPSVEFMDSKTSADTVESMLNDSDILDCMIAKEKSIDYLDQSLSCLSVLIHAGLPVLASVFILQSMGYIRYYTGSLSYDTNHYPLIHLQAGIGADRVLLPFISYCRH